MSSISDMIEQRSAERWPEVVELAAVEASKDTLDAYTYEEHLAMAYRALIGEAG